MGKFLSKLQERGYAGFINVSNGDEISDLNNNMIKSVCIAGIKAG